MWGQNILVVIIPSILAITYLGQSTYLQLADKPTSIYRLLVTWIAPDGAKTFVQGQVFIANWGITLTITSYAASLAVNTLVTGLIVFRILKVFLEVTEATSVERTLGSTGGTTLRHIMFVIIESGMTLFALQLVRLVLEVQPEINALSILLIGIIQMFNVIIRFVHFFSCFTDEIYLARASHQQ